MLSLLEQFPRPRSRNEAEAQLCLAQDMMSGEWEDIDEAFNNPSSMSAFETFFMPSMMTHMASARRFNLIRAHRKEKERPLSWDERKRVEAQLRVNVDCTPNVGSPCYG
ncbi:hypothetical protein IAR50_007490 [Cryptococcus sp. DSM 104548]